MLLCLLLIVSITMVMHSCLQFRMSKSEIDTFFKNKSIEVEQHTYTVSERTINYVFVGKKGAPLIVFVHGSPGSLSAFIDFLADSALLNNARLIAVDRPGFGSSDFGDAEPSLEKQAALLKPILEKHNEGSKAILVGHSLGGPLIARMVIDYPELIGGLIMVAPSIDPELEPTNWYRKPMAVPPLRWILPRSIRASNDELIHFRRELEDMLPLWNKISTPTIVIQGKKDRLVPFENAFFAKEKLTNASVSLRMIDGMDHFVPWSNPELIYQAIDDLLRNNVTATNSK